MAGRGVHFAPSGDEARHLRALPDGRGRLDDVADGRHVLFSVDP
ncbi:hypothetical protein [Tautonia plasticadhaerens]|uniref:Uncharacterized protein n=1 Tax=Tautonia plasticadhaerens TaxID=2527974 RepID=A0A518H2U6_9BACT|nr:hypothetical protein [Tautonia plasticadhaerens]QDV35158.1 hypothetical protein ElP_30610 [Tautonia plasticadhaerens]